MSYIDVNMSHKKVEVPQPPVKAYFQPPKITEASAKILIDLAVNGPLEQSKMPKIIEKTYRTVIRELQKLKETGLIRFIEARPSIGRGPAKNVYGPTLTGIIVAFNIFTNTNGAKQGHRFIEQTAQTNPDLLPLIFGKWKLFQEHQLYNEDQIKKERFKKKHFFRNDLTYLLIIGLGGAFSAIINRITFLHNEELLKKELTFNCFFGTSLDPREFGETNSLHKWGSGPYHFLPEFAKVAKEDMDLREYFDKIFNLRKTYYSTQSKNAEYDLNMWNEQKC